MEEVLETERDIPDNFFVFKIVSTKTKLRTVFDGSAKTFNGDTSNDVMMIVSAVQESLSAIFLKFRRYPIALPADVAKMYRQLA